MGRRRQGPPPPKGPTYEAAKSGIDMMERAVIWRTVDITFTPDDLLYVCWPEDTIKRLKAAFGLTAGSHMSSERIDHPGLVGSSSILSIRVDKLGMLVPSDDIVIQMDAPKAPDFIIAMTQIADIHKEFNKLRHLTSWFGKNGVTYGCARFNVPSLMSLLPPEHGIHQVQGNVFKDTVFPQDIIDLMREVPSIITKGLLADPKNTAGPENPLVTLNVAGGLVVNLV